MMLMTVGFLKDKVYCLLVIRPKSSTFIFWIRRVINKLYLLKVLYKTFDLLFRALDLKLYLMISIKLKNLPERNQ